MATNTGSNTTAGTSSGGDYNGTTANTNSYTFDGMTGNTAATSNWIPANNWIPTTTQTGTINGGWTTTIPNYLTYDYGQDARLKQLEEKVSQLEAEKMKNAWITLGIDTAWTDLRLMLNNMREFVKLTPGSEILAADTPKELKVGFVCAKTCVVWEIKIQTIRAHQEEMWVSDGKAILIPWCFETQEGKMLLLDMINGK